MSDAPQIVDDKGRFIELSDEQLAQLDDAKRRQYRHVGKTMKAAKITDGELVASQNRVVECARALEAAQSRVPRTTAVDAAKSWIALQTAQRGGHAE